MGSQDRGTRLELSLDLAFGHCCSYRKAGPWGTDGSAIEWGWGLRGVAREKKGASKGLEGQPTFQDSFKLNKGMEFSGKTPVTGMTQG